LVLDHVLIDVVDAFRHAFEGALLQRQAVEERFQVDVFLGDVAWETSYSLPGEDNPPRVRADLSVDWPTWSQSAYRSWSIGEPPEELPELLVEVALRVQRLASAPDLSAVVAALPAAAPPVGPDALETGSDATLQHVHHAVEVTYEGTWRLDEQALEDPAKLGTELGPLGQWVASTLVRLADLDLAFLPPDADDGP
jgi:hypothetical protein